MSRPDPAFGDAENAAARGLIELSLLEDGARQDVTTLTTIGEHHRGRAILRSRQPGVLCGLPCVDLTFEALGGGVTVEASMVDGEDLAAGETIAVVEGSLRTILSAERTFLNLACSLSGTATLTRSFVERAGRDCAVLDTRKTWPGYRVLQKYAVRCGGGRNHRMGLSDAIMIKDNHHAGGLSLEEMVAKLRAQHADLQLIVEADDLAAVERALSLSVDRILLDNFDAPAVRRAVTLRDAASGRVGLEVSGGVALDSVAELAAAGADMVSVGALTHSAVALDLGLDIEDEASFE